MPRIQLDADQLAAVAHAEGPCLVLAGPGSGKTRVIVERFLRLCDSGVLPQEQLVLTYTRRAAAEMRERAEEAFGPLPDDNTLANYHSFALSVVRDWGWRLGISPGFHVADAAERWLHTEAVLRDLRPATLWNPLRPHDLIAWVLDVVKTAKQELVTPERYLEWAASRLESCADAAERVLLERHRDCALVYGQLQERYRRHAVIDFEDSILFAEQLVRGDAAAQRAVAGRIRFLMVDEFQDTDYAQSQLIDALMGGRRNILVVADDDQSIYKFRGASRANLDRFEAAYPDRSRLILSRNYRSSEQIVRVARTLIAAASPGSRIEKQLAATRGSGSCVQLWQADAERAEMHAIAAECRALIESGTRPGDIAVLFRRHVDMQAAIRALQSAGVPYQVQGGRGYFQQPEIKDLLALLAAANDPQDSQALVRCLMLPSWSVSPAGRLALVNACHEHDRPLLDVVRSGGVRDLDQEDLAATRRCLDAVVELRARAEREDVREIFHAALDTSGFLAILDLKQPLERMQCGANLNRFGELLETFAEWSDDRRLGTAMRYLEALRSTRDADELAPVEPLEDGVVLLTAHAAKGLEWPIVFVPDCVEARWPGSFRVAAGPELPDELVPEQPPEGDAAGDEERRLFYVAATRARDRLVFTHAQRYPRSFRDRDERRSPFLGGVDDEGMPVERTNVPSAPDFALPRRRRPGAPLETRPTASVSALRDFRACPRRFQYAHVYHMPRPDSHQRWYGQLIHGVLQNAAMRRAAGATIDGQALARLWSEAWEASPGRRGRHAELRPLGAEQLLRYGDSPAWRDADIVEIEQPIAIRTAAADILGRFDRIDRDANGSLLVVDYKTGPPRDREAEGRDLQVRAYAVALAQRERTDRVTVELHRLQTTEITTVALTRGQLDTAVRQLSATAAELGAALRTRDFPPKPSAWLCGRCDYRTVCDEGRSASAT